jgi:hypothetical protein
MIVKCGWCGKEVEVKSGFGGFVICAYCCSTNKDKKKGSLNE